jgi:hypothetical protein
VVLTGLPVTGTVYGSSVAGAGDVNADGYADVIVGVDRDSNPGPCVVYLGGQAGPAGTPSFTLAVAAGADSTFGTSVAMAGDVNGDGYSDVLVGAWGAMRAYVYLGGASGLATTPATTLSAPEGTGGTFGFVASAGDVNGDGFADVLVGGNVFLGSVTGISTRAITLTETGGMTGAFGTAVSSAGDVNGDGFADVLVGDYAVFDAEANTQGDVGVYLGNAMGVRTVASATLTSPTASVFGITVFGATN